MKGTEKFIQDFRNRNIFAKFAKKKRKTIADTLTTPPSDEIVRMRTIDTVAEIDLILKNY